MTKKQRTRFMRDLKRATGLPFLVAVKVAKQLLRGEYGSPHIVSVSETPPHGWPEMEEPPSHYEVKGPKGFFDPRRA